MTHPRKGRSKRPHDAARLLVARRRKYARATVYYADPKLRAQDKRRNRAEAYLAEYHGASRLDLLAQPS